MAPFRPVVAGATSASGVKTHWRGRGRYSISDSKFCWLFERMQAMITVCANCSPSCRRRTCPLAALQFEYRDADRTIPTEAPAWWLPRPTSCQPLPVLRRSSSCGRRGRDGTWLNSLQQGINSGPWPLGTLAVGAGVCPTAPSAAFGSTKTGQSGAVLFRR